MTEDEARDWLRKRFDVSRETKLEAFVELLIAESQRQNLIAASTLEQVWSRHIVDSAQLIPLAGEGQGPWIDIGSGAGLPGMVVAILTDRPVVMVEPRARRVEFLRDSAEALDLTDRVTVVGSKIESYKPDKPAQIVSARAVAELSALLLSARHCTDRSTIWLLPKGRNAQSEVAAARRAWQGVFHVEPSITSPDSGIVIAREIAPR